MRNFRITEPCGRGNCTEVAALDLFFGGEGTMASSVAEKVLPHNFKRKNGECRKNVKENLI